MAPTMSNMWDDVGNVHMKNEIIMWSEQTLRLIMKTEYKFDVGPITSQADLLLYQKLALKYKIEHPLGILERAVPKKKKKNSVRKGRSKQKEEEEEKSSVARQLGKLALQEKEKPKTSSSAHSTGAEGSCGSSSSADLAIPGPSHTRPTFTGLLKGRKVNGQGAKRGRLNHEEEEDHEELDYNTNRTPVTEKMDEDSSEWENEEI